MLEYIKKNLFNRSVQEPQANENTQTDEEAQTTVESISPEARIKTLEEELAQLKKDKTTENHVLRKAAISVLTYASASLFLYSINISSFHLHAFVPTGGYLLSTLHLPQFCRDRL